APAASRPARGPGASPAPRRRRSPRRLPRRGNDEGSRQVSSLNDAWDPWPRRVRCRRRTGGRNWPCVGGGRGGRRGGGRGGACGVSGGGRIRRRKAETVKPSLPVLPFGKAIGREARRLEENPNPPGPGRGPPPEPWG